MFSGWLISNLNPLAALIPPLCGLTMYLLGPGVRTPLGSPRMARCTGSQRGENCRGHVQPGGFSEEGLAHLPIRSRSRGSVRGERRRHRA